MNNQLNHINKNSFWGTIIISIIPVTVFSLSYEEFGIYGTAVIIMIICCLYFIKFRQDIIIDYLKMKQDEELTRNR